MCTLSDPEMFNQMFDGSTHSAWILEGKTDRQTIRVKKVGRIMADFIPRWVSVLPTTGQALLEM